jgi:hypothetical protein
LLCFTIHVTVISQVSLSLVPHLLTGTSSSSVPTWMGSYIKNVGAQSAPYFPPPPPPSFFERIQI